MVKVKFHGCLSTHFADIELSGANPRVILSGVQCRYKNFKLIAAKHEARCLLEDGVLHILPKSHGAWFFAAISVIGAIGSIYGVGVAINQRRIQKQNKKKLSRESESSLFEGVINSDTQGGPIPLGFGECYGGTVVINNVLEAY
ncbi:hypothetical protein [Vibrio astriarenae]|uniref:hypothetical protein n=1 Tax=Vibrio astriarenae TaxID=1481923 RepID=UPI0037370C27